MCYKNYVFEYFGKAIPSKIQVLIKFGKAILEWIEKIVPSKIQVLINFRKVISPKVDIFKKCGKLISFKIGIFHLF